MPKKPEKVFIILDAHALIHRAFHALPPFTSPAGEPVGAVYGVASVLFKLVREFNPAYIAAAFDRPEPTFRHEAYADYKATRAEVSPEIIPQFNKTKELFKAFNVAVYEKPGSEADDIIGTLVSLIKKEKQPIKVIIASGDLDAVQLVEAERVVVYTLKKGINDTIIYNEQAVKDRFGFGPKLLPDYKGLRGDASDNIKGVPGIGEKTAELLIQKFGSLDVIYKSLPKVKKEKSLRGNVAELLEENKDAAFFSRDLALIRRDVPIQFHLKDALWDTYNQDEVAAFLRKLNFASLIKRLPGNGAGGGAPPRTSGKRQPGLFESGPAAAHAASSLVHLAGSAAAAFFHKAEKEKTVSWLISESGGSAYAALGAVCYEIPGETVAAFKTEFSKLFSNPGITHLGFSAKPLLAFFWERGVAACGISFDAAIASWVVNPTLRAPDIIRETKEYLKNKEAASAVEALSNLPLLVGALTRELKKNDLLRVFKEIEMPLIAVLARMERSGILLDAAALKKFSRALEKSLAAREKKIYKLAGIKFNINSPKQLAEILFKTIGIKTEGIRKTGAGGHSTRASELSKLSGEYPLVAEVMRYREEMKLKSTYVDVLPALADSKDGRIHTTFNQTGTVTGRLSSQDPNLQNIPARTELGRNIRASFVAAPGYELVSFDYSQIELRLAAVFANDKKMIKAFEDGEDIHALTAAEINAVPLHEVTPVMRRAAKTINFGILYGMGAVSLAESLGISRAEAQRFIQNYFAHFPRIRSYIDELKRRVLKYGYVETISGRKRYFNDPAVLGWQARRAEERMAVNAPIQGSEADIIKKAMIEISRTLLPRQTEGARMLLQVHDELLFEIKTELVAELVSGIKRIMENVYKLKVSIRVDVKRGPNWRSMLLVS